MYVIYYTDSQQLLSEVSSKYIDLHPARKQTDMLSSMVSKMMGIIPYSKTFRAVGHMRQGSMLRSIISC